MSSVIPKELVDFLTSGVSILIATRDAQNMPEAARAFAPSVAADRRHMDVLIQRDLGARTFANLEDNGRIAMAFSRAIDHVSVQLKGVCRAMRPATDADRPAIERYHGAYIEGLYLIGLPRSLTSRFRLHPAVVVTAEIESVFNQTPGPGAGRPFEVR